MQMEMCMKEIGKIISLFNKMKKFFLFIILFLSSSLYADVIYLDCNKYEVCVYLPKNQGCNDSNNNFSLIFDEKNEKAEISEGSYIDDLNVLGVNDHMIILGSNNYTKKDYNKFKEDHIILEDWHFTLTINRISGEGAFVSYQDTITQRREYSSCTLKDEKLF